MCSKKTYTKRAATAIYSFKMLLMMMTMTVAVTVAVTMIMMIAQYTYYTNENDFNSYVTHTSQLTKATLHSLS